MGDIDMLVCNRSMMIIIIIDLTICIENSQVKFN